MESISGIGSIRFSGVFDPIKKEDVEQIFNFHKSGSENNFRFHVHRKTIERFWRNILFRMFDKGVYSVVEYYDVDGKSVECGYGPDGSVCMSFKTRW